MTVLIKCASEIIQNPQSSRPHVVILGAGASVATQLDCNSVSNKLPTMDNFVEILKLTKILERSGNKKKKNFEEIYSNLTDDILKKEIEEKVRKYFFFMEA